MSSSSISTPSLRTCAAIGAGVLAGGYVIHRVLQYVYGGTDPVASRAGACFRRCCPVSKCPPKIVCAPVVDFAVADSDVE